MSFDNLKKAEEKTKIQGIDAEKYTLVLKFLFEHPKHGIRNKKIYEGLEEISKNTQESMPTVCFELLEEAINAYNNAKE